MVWAGRIVGTIIVILAIVALALGIRWAWNNYGPGNNGSNGGGRSSCPIVTDELNGGSYASTSRTDANGRFCKISQLDHAIQIVTPPNTWTDLWDGTRTHNHVPPGTKVIGNEFSFWPDP